MSEYDINRADSYAMHLAAVNQTQQVLATEDIVNEKGVLLVKKGQPIRSETAQRLINHRLLRPLDASVSVSEALEGRHLFRDVMALVENHPELHAVHHALNIDPSLKQVCFLLKTYPLVAQKMTILALRLPDEYRKALFCAWFAVALAIQLRDPEVDQQEAFFAALAHNLGLLHIDPAIVVKVGAYTPDEWRAVQSHPLIGAMFISHVPGFGPGVSRAVREHHERGDGSGYPAALWEDRLSLLGQTVALADTTWGICNATQEKLNHRLADVLTVIKMNRAQFPATLESALYHLQYRAQQFMQRRPPVQRDAAGGAARLQRLQAELDARFAVTSALRPLLEPQTDDPLLRGVYVRSQRIWFVVNGSGILCKDLTSAELEDCSDSGSDYRHYELALMLAELRWQFFQLERALQQVLGYSKSCPPAARQLIETTLAKMRELTPYQVDAAFDDEAEPDELRWARR